MRIKTTDEVERRPAGRQDVDFDPRFLCEAQRGGQPVKMLVRLSEGEIADPGHGFALDRPSARRKRRGGEALEAPSPTMLEPDRLRWKLLALPPMA